MTNRFTKTSFFVQGGIMRPPSDGGLKTIFHIEILNRQIIKKWPEIEKKVENLVQFTFNNIKLSFPKLF